MHAKRPLRPRFTTKTKTTNCPTCVANIAGIAAFFGGLVDRANHLVYCGSASGAFLDSPVQAADCDRQ